MTHPGGKSPLAMWRGNQMLSGISKKQTLIIHPDYKRIYIVKEDYIIFMDMLYNGTPEDKHKISFMMCDVKGEGKVLFEDYKRFCLSFLAMYEELTQMKMNIGHQQEEIIAVDFDKLVGATGDPKTDSLGRQYFTREDFD